jgi:DNA-binding response OmpR family regulator
VKLDLLLKELNGLEVLRRIRKTSSVPVIMLTARDAVMDKVSGLDMGADDYITKPFAIEELLARIRLVMRKAEASASHGEELTFGPVKLSVSRHEVTCEGKPVELTGKEFALLEVLLRNKNVVMSRDSLMERVWGYDYVGETNVVDVYVRYLRSKIDDVYGIHMIRTVRGVGYGIME